MNGKELMEKEIYPSKIVFVMKVPVTVHVPVHKDRPFHGFAYHLQGEKTYHFEGKTDIDIEPDTIIYLPKGSSYNETGAKRTKSCYAINFETVEKLNCDPFLYRPKDPAKILGLFREAEVAWRKKNSGYIEKCSACLSEIISIMKSDFNTNYSSSKQRELIAPALEYIMENYTSEKINIKELAEMCSISSVYLRKLFMNSVGKNPLAYINTLRLERGYELLKNGDYTVSAAARDCGFTDVGYFTREFKKHFGFAPGNLKDR